MHRLRRIVREVDDREAPVPEREPRVGICEESANGSSYIRGN